MDVRQSGVAVVSDVEIEIDLRGRENIEGFIADRIDRNSRDPARTPIVSLRDRCGVGKSSLIREIGRYYEGIRPSVTVDFAKADDADVLRVLVAIASGIRRGVPRAGRIALPRVDLGLAVRKYQLHDDDALNEWLRERGLARRVISAVQEWEKIIESLLILTPAPHAQYAARVGAAVVKGSIVVGDHYYRNSLERARGWYAAYGSARGFLDGENPLFWLSGTDAQRAASLLSAALLADLGADFRKTTNCLALLDHVERGAGISSLTTLADSRKLARENRGIARLSGIDSLILVAAQGAGPEAGLGEHGTDWIRATLPPLTAETASYQIKNPVTGSNKDDARFLVTLSGGHQKGFRRLRNILTDSFTQPDFDRHGLLDEESGDGSLLADLFPAADALTSAFQQAGLGTFDIMAICAATPGLHEPACVSALTQLTRMPDQRAADGDMTVRQAVAGTRALLKETMWADTALTVHPLAGALLANRLARGAGDLWGRTHEAFANYYRGDSYSGADKETRTWYHQLAGMTAHDDGTFARFVEYLSGEFKHGRIQEWNDLLRGATAAPNRLPARRSARATVTDLGGRAIVGDLKGVIGRLAAALLLHHDPLVDFKDDLGQIIRTEYQNLDDYPGGGGFYAIAERDFS